MKILMCVLVIAFAALASNVADVVGNEGPYLWSGPSGGGPIWSPSLAILFDNGPFVTHEGIGYAGADVSMMEPTDNVYGFGIQRSAGNMGADDFEIPAGETWNITKITVFGYQTNSGPSPTLNGLYIAIYDDPPTTGSMVYGDMNNNVFTTASFTNCYRVLNGDASNSARPVMAAEAQFTDLTLPAGEYWLVFQLDGVSSSGPWGNPVAILGETATGNAMQYTSSGWANLIDSGNGAPKGLPFIIEGNTTALERASWGSIKNSF
jgi:hypothetical protein